MLGHQLLGITTYIFIVYGFQVDLKGMGMQVNYYNVVLKMRKIGIRQAFVL
jgi:hypothetical protein